MVERDHGYGVVDTILNKGNFAHGGAFTSVGHYPFSEMATLLNLLSKETSTSVDKHLHDMGNYIFDYFINEHGTFLDNHTNVFDFLESVENHIHIEVNKLYPKAELPHFDTERVSDDYLKMTYLSSRKMSAFAHGIIEMACKYYNNDCEIKKEVIDQKEDKVLFHIKSTGR